MKPNIFCILIFGVLFQNASTTEDNFCPRTSCLESLRYIISETCPVEYDERCNDYKIYDPIEAIPYPCGNGHASYMNLDRVDILNATTLQEWLQHKDEGHRTWCMIVLFYLPTCSFANKIAPPFNAIPSNYQNLKAVAVDATDFTRLNSRYGIAGSPTVLMFINGLPVSRMETEPLTSKGLKDFITKHSDIPITGSSSMDEGPVSINPDDDQGFIPLLVSILILLLATSYYKRDWLLNTPISQSFLPRIGLAPQDILEFLNGP